MLGLTRDFTGPPNIEDNLNEMFVKEGDRNGAIGIGSIIKYNLYNDTLL